MPDGDRKQADLRSMPVREYMENSFMSESMQSGQEMQMEDAIVLQEELNMDPAGAEQQAEEAAGTVQQAEEAAGGEQQAEDLAASLPPEKDILSIKAAVEAVLFAMGDSLDLETISEAVGMPAPELEKVLKEMTEDYDAPGSGRGIHIIKLEDRYQLATKKECYPVLIRLARQPRKVSLSDVVMETLSIIAYKQPVTRVEIEKIRGVKCEHAINRLIEYNLIREVGRLDAPGRPILFGTTEEFLRHFGTGSLDELPAISPVKVEDFKAEAEEEARVQLGI